MKVDVALGVRATLSSKWELRRRNGYPSALKGFLGEEEEEGSCSQRELDPLDRRVVECRWAVILVASFTSK